MLSSSVFFQNIAISPRFCSFRRYFLNRNRKKQSVITLNIIARNEEHNIAECIQSAAWADEIIVVDGESTDGTAAAARTAGAKVIVNPWEGYAAQRRFALARASGDWIFVLDADERCTPELRDAILAIAENPKNAADGYRVPRKSFCLGEWVKHCGWYPGYQTRLFRKDKVRVAERLVHEGYEVDGKMEILPFDILHYTLPSVRGFMTKVNSFAWLQAREKQHRKKVGMIDIVLRPLSTFLRSYIVRLGFLDGIPGLVVCYFDVITNMLTYMNIYELQKQQAEEKKNPS